MKYQQVAELFSKAKYPSKGKPVASNTRLHMKSGGDYTLVLHGTPIITWHLDGMITLNDGGWNTPTTYRRMNEFLPSSIHVYRKDWNTEINLHRTSCLSSSFHPMKHITKPVYEGEPTNYNCVSPMEKLYGKRATHMILEPTGVSQHDEYILSSVWQVIV